MRLNIITGPSMSGKTVMLHALMEFRNDYGRLKLKERKAKHAELQKLFVTSIANGTVVFIDEKCSMTYTQFQGYTWGKDLTEVYIAVTDLSQPQSALLPELEKIVASSAHMRRVVNLSPFVMTKTVIVGKQNDQP